MSDDKKDNDIGGFQTRIEKSSNFSKEKARISYRPGGGEEAEEE